MNLENLFRYDDEGPNLSSVNDQTIFLICSKSKKNIVFNSVMIRIRKRFSSHLVLRTSQLDRAVFQMRKHKPKFRVYSRCFKINEGASAAQKYFLQLFTENFNAYILMQCFRMGPYTMYNQLTIVIKTIISPRYEFFKIGILNKYVGVFCFFFGCKIVL